MPRTQDSAGILVSLEVQPIHERKGVTCHHEGQCTPINTGERFCVISEADDTVGDLLRNGTEMLKEICKVEETCIYFTTARNELHAVLAPSFKISAVFPPEVRPNGCLVKVTPQRRGAHHCISPRKRTIGDITPESGPAPKRTRGDALTSSAPGQTQPPPTSAQRPRLDSHGGTASRQTRSPRVIAESSQLQTEVETGPDEDDVALTQFTQSDADVAAEVDDEVIVRDSQVSNLDHPEQPGTRGPPVQRVMAPIFLGSQNQPQRQRHTGMQQQSRRRCRQQRSSQQLPRAPHGFQPRVSSQPQRSSQSRLSSSTGVVRATHTNGPRGRHWTWPERLAVAQGSREGMTSAGIVEAFNLGHSESAVRNCRRWLNQNRPALMASSQLDTAAAARAVEPLQLVSGGARPAVAATDVCDTAPEVPENEASPREAGNIDGLIRDSLRRRVRNGRSRINEQETVMTGGLGEAEDTPASVNRAIRQASRTSGASSSAVRPRFRQPRTAIDSNAGMMVPFVPTLVASCSAPTPVIQQQQFDMDDAEHTESGIVDEEDEFTDGDGVGRTVMARLSEEEVEEIPRTHELTHQQMRDRSIPSDCTSGGAQIVPKQLEAEEFGSHRMGRVLGEVHEAGGLAMQSPPPPGALLMLPPPPPPPQQPQVLSKHQDCLSAPQKTVVADSDEQGEADARGSVAGASIASREGLIRRRQRQKQRRRARKQERAMAAAAAAAEAVSSAARRPA